MKTRYNDKKIKRFSIIKKCMFLYFYFLSFQVRLSSMLIMNSEIWIWKHVRQTLTALCYLSQSCFNCTIDRNIETYRVGYYVLELKPILRLSFKCP